MLTVAGASVTTWSAALSGAPAVGSGADEGSGPRQEAGERPVDVEIECVRGLQLRHRADLRQHPNQAAGVPEGLVSPRGVERQRQGGGRRAAAEWRPRAVDQQGIHVVRESARHSALDLEVARRDLRPRPAHRGHGAGHPVPYRLGRGVELPRQSLDRRGTRGLLHSGELELGPDAGLRARCFVRRVCLGRALVRKRRADGSGHAGGWLLGHRCDGGVRVDRGGPGPDRLLVAGLVRVARPAVLQLGRSGDLQGPGRRGELVEDRRQVGRSRCGCRLWSLKEVVVLQRRREEVAEVGLQVGDQCP